MPINKKYLAIFESSRNYHVYNRTNNKELLFLNDENRFFFLKRYGEILSPFIDTYCWCLLPNHFHLLIRVKGEKEIQDYLNNIKSPLTITEKKFIRKEISITVLIEKSFTRFFHRMHKLLIKLRTGWETFFTSLLKEF